MYQTSLFWIHLWFYIKYRYEWFSECAVIDWKGCQGIARLIEDIGNQLDYASINQIIHTANLIISDCVNKVYPVSNKQQHEGIGRLVPNIYAHPQNCIVVISKLRPNQYGLRRYSQVIFYLKCLNFNLDFIEICSFLPGPPFTNMVYL